MTYFANQTRPHCFIDSVCDAEFGAVYGHAGGSAKYHFWEVNLIWLARMWRGPSESRWDMIDFIFMLYLLKFMI